MIKKITVSDYLKRLDNMNGEERQKYNERVGEWLRSNTTQCIVCHMSDPGAQLQNILQVSTGWNDIECQAFEEGALLLTALVHREETWLPDMLYSKSAKRVIRRMVEILKGVTMTGDSPLTEEKIPDKGQVPVSKPAEKTTIKNGGATTVAPSTRSTTVTQQSADPAKGPSPDSNGVSNGDSVGRDKNGKEQTELKPVRPKHIDQYVHLLPTKTQERAAQVKDLLRELDEAREKMRLLMGDETASAADREAWAKKATAIDNKVRKIYDELDREWDKFVKEGRVMLDDLGNAHIVESPAENTQPMTGDSPLTEEKTELTPEQKKKRKDLRKWLCDTRYGNGATREDYVKRWKEKFKEYLELEGKAVYEDEKILAAAGHYGIANEVLYNL